jgi:hypothetical protein
MEKFIEQRKEHDKEANLWRGVETKNFTVCRDQPYVVNCYSTDDTPAAEIPFD